MAKRKKSRNPSGLATAAVVAIGLLGVGAVFVMSEKKPAKKKGKAEPSPEPMPAPAAEYGIFINATCTDFVVKEPPAGTDTLKLPQTMSMSAIVEEAVKAGGDIDPFNLAGAWLVKVAPANCVWPPATGATPRISNMYIYMASLFAMMAIHQGGTVLGISTAGMTDTDPDALAEAVDEAILALAEELGLPDYDSSVIPDLVPPSDGLGQTSAEPVVLSATPNVFTVSEKPVMTILDGDNLVTGMLFRLVDPNQGIEAPSTTTWAGDKPQITFVPRLGDFIVQMRPLGGTWENTDVVVSMTAAQSGLLTN